MSVEQIDQILVAWEERLKRVDDNLLALEAEPAYQVLSGAGTKKATLEGKTKEKVLPALDALIELFEHRERLTEVLDRAKEIRASISALTFWNTDEKLLEVRQLLYGPSIKMGAKPTPLAQRNLLDAAATDVAIVPEQLLMAMAHAYEAARDAVLEVQRAWDTLEPTIERAEKDAGALRATAASLGVEEKVAPEVEAVEKELEALRGRIAKDPLGVTDSIGGSVPARLAALKSKLDGLAGQRDRVKAELVKAEALKRRVEEVHVTARDAFVRGRFEIEEAATLPVPSEDSVVEGLGPWLAKLESTAKAGRWHPAEVGLTRWFETAQQILVTDRSVKETFESYVSRRAELLGRLSARRAQLAAKGIALSAAAEKHASEAEALLRKKPTPLGQANVLVDAFEAAVRTRRAP